jgi:hypothetical protein
MKKVILLTMFAVLTGFGSQAQSLKFGVKAGANFSNLDGDDFDGDNLTSFHAGVLAEIGIFQNFAIQPEVMYSSQGSKVDGDDLKLDYISVPIVAKFYLITDRLSIEAGPQFSFLINDDGFDGIITDYKNENFDFAAVGGVGLNITQNFFASARYVVGLTDTSKDAEVTNRVIQLSLGYKF